MLPEMFSLHGRIAVVTGGLGQLGRQYVRTLASAGAKVAVLDLAQTGARMKDSFGDLVGAGDVTFVGADITSRSNLEGALTAISSQWGVPHVLINNAALDAPPNAPASENGPFESYPESSWDKVMEVNVKGTMLACQVFGGAMAKKGRGSIINIGSIYGAVSPDQSIYEYRRRRGETFFKPVAYSASKSAIYNLTRYLATYWGAQNVRVNALTLAGVYNNQDEQFLEGYLRKTPLKRMAREEEYNGAILFLASDASSYATGSTLVIDGGWTAW